MNLVVLLFTVLLLLIHNVNGFLLDGPTNSGKQTTAGSQFLTNTEFLQAKNLLKQNTDDLRHDMDKTFALMTTQLKSKFDLLESKLAEVNNRNETHIDCVPMEKYIALEQILTNVQRENEQMKQKNTMAENELLSLKNNFIKQDIKIKELQKLGTIKSLQEVSALQQNVYLNTDKVHSLTTNDQARSQDFLALYNITTATGKRVNEIEKSTNYLILQLKHNLTMKIDDMNQTLDTQLTSFQTCYNTTVNDLQTKDIDPLRKRVQLNTDKIHYLAMNEQARSQDFFALYNITTVIGKKVTEMETSTKNLILQLKYNHTTEVKAMKHNLDVQLTSFMTNYSSSINDLKQISENNERVLLFAWSSGKAGSVIQFRYVKVSIGITNISAFKDSGKFVCEKKGIYLIAATVSSQYSYTSFCINRDSETVACAEIAQHAGEAYHSGTSVIVLPLNVNDDIYVDTSHTIERDSWTHLTIMKM